MDSTSLVAAGVASLVFTVGDGRLDKANWRATFCGRRTDDENVPKSHFESRSRTLSRATERAVSDGSSMS
jgi:hypothetical protein